MKFHLENITETNVNNIQIHDQLRSPLLRRLQDYMLSTNFLNKTAKTYYEERHHVTLESMKLHVKFHILDTVTRDAISGMAILAKS